MNLNDLSLIRLANQRVSASDFRTPGEIVGWMGAMQAQDYNMSKWAIGIRLPGCTVNETEAAFDSGEIIRMHLLRPTWHLVASEDVHWMLELCGQRIRASMKARDHQLGLTVDIFKKSNKLLEKTLGGGKHLTREELIREFRHAGINTEENRASHLLMHAETHGIICSGKIKAGKPSYTMLHEWVPKSGTMNKEEALATLAERYFSSHGPATAEDFIWWSGLTAGDGKKALEMVKSNFSSTVVEDKIFWYRDHSSEMSDQPITASLIPAFDELIISYKDRQAVLPDENHSKAVYTNGIFRPVILLNGRVVGIWKQTVKKEHLTVTAELFDPTDENVKESLRKAAIPLGIFTNKKISVV